MTVAPKSPTTPATSEAGERLQKLLSAAGVASRRHAEALMAAGRVSVNGRVVRELGSRADPHRDVVTVDGERLDIGRSRRTILLHKPRGVVSTMSDPEGRPTVRDLVRGLPERLYPVGRLDMQTSGVLLLTNDGTLAARLLAGEQGVERVYHVKVDGRPGPRTIERLRRGVRLGPGAPVTAGVRVLHELPTKTWLEVRVRRGQWHVVRRLCEAVGHRVDKLERVAFGPVELGQLPPGAFRDATRAELAALREAAGLTAPSAHGAASREAAPRAVERRSGTRRRTPERRSRARPRTGRSK
jgi:23S rRNA pseudouridine2605 synthase